MDRQPPIAPDEFWWADPPLKQRLRNDPVGVLKELGANVPPGLPVGLIHEIIRIGMLLWVDGNIVPRDKFHIDPNDEGLLFGRGVWESTRTVDGLPWLWNLHLDRMRRTVELLEFNLDSKRLPTAEQIGQYVRSFTGQDVLVRVNATAGRLGKPGMVWMSMSPRPRPRTADRLQSCRNPVPKDQPYLSWKTFQYATRLRIGQLAMCAGFDTALLLDEQDNLLEASHANIFVRLPDGWVTPRADGGFLPGTVRQHLLENAPLKIREETVPYAALANAREVFLTNSSLGIIPVSQIDERAFPLGSETQALIRWILPASAL